MKHSNCATWLAYSGLLMALFSLTFEPSHHGRRAGRQIANRKGRRNGGGTASRRSPKPVRRGPVPQRRKARDELARRGVEILPQLLAAMDTSNVVAANWYRTVYEEIVARSLATIGRRLAARFS